MRSLIKEYASPVNFRTLNFCRIYKENRRVQVCGEIFKAIGLANHDILCQKRSNLFAEWSSWQELGAKADPSFVSRETIPKFV